MKDETHLHFDQKKKKKTLDLLATFFMFLESWEERKNEDKLHTPLEP